MKASNVYSRNKKLFRHVLNHKKANVQKWSHPLPVPTMNTHTHTHPANSWK